MARYLQTEKGRKYIYEKKIWLLRTEENIKSMGRKMILINKWKRENPGGNYREHLEEVFGYVLPLCFCGCGNKVLKINNKYILGHNRSWEGKKRPPISIEQKRKMREAHLGRKYNMTEHGKSVLRENMRKAHSTEAREKIRKFLTGRKLPPEHVKNAMKRRPITSLELAFQKIIQDNELPYKFVGNGAFIIDGLNPDFININGEKIAIEVFSRFYKEIDGGTVEEYKSERIKRLSPFGWKLFFFDETQVRSEYVLNILGGDSH